MTPTVTETSGIQIRQLHKSYGSLDVLSGLDLTLPAGHIYGLVGPNGAGKTTLMSTICNHTFPSGGTILVDGENPAENAGVLERMCFIHEDQPYNDVFSVASILHVMPNFYPDWDAALAQRLVARFQVPVERRARKLSRGQKSAEGGSGVGSAPAGFWPAAKATAARRVASRRASTSLTCSRRRPTSPRSLSNSLK